MRSTSEPLLPVDDPVALIRSRIKEKRIFEARFLCRQLGNEMGAAEKKALEQELNKILEQVARLRQEARALLAQGEHGKAGALYAEMEAMAIDVPGVVEEKRALAGAEALAARIGASTMPQQALSKPEPDHRTVSIEATSPQPTAVASRRRWPPSQRLLLASGLLGLVGLAVLLLLFRASSGPSYPAPSPPPTEPQTIVIRPLVDPPPAVDNSPTTAPMPPASEPVQDMVPPETSAPEQNSTVQGEAPTPPSAVHLGTLQVETSTH